MVIPKSETRAQTAMRIRQRLFLQTAAMHDEINLGIELRQKVFEPLKAEWAKLALPPVTERSDAQHQAAHQWSVQFEQLLHEWAAARNIDHEWVCDCGRDQIAWWFADSGKGEPFAMIPLYSEPDPVFIDPWSPLVESEREYASRMRQRFNKALKTYVTIAKRWPDPIKSELSRANHYRWAVERVCLGWPYEKILSGNTTRPGLNAQAIGDALANLLPKLNLVLKQKTTET